MAARMGAPKSFTHAGTGVMVGLGVVVGVLVVVGVEGGACVLCVPGRLVNLPEAMNQVRIAKLTAQAPNTGKIHFLPPFRLGGWVEFSGFFTPGGFFISSFFLPPPQGIITWLHYCSRLNLLHIPTGTGFDRQRFLLFSTKMGENESCQGFNVLFQWLGQSIQPVCPPKIIAHFRGGLHVLDAEGDDGDTRLKAWLISLRMCSEILEWAGQTRTNTLLRSMASMMDLAKCCPGAMSRGAIQQRIFRSSSFAHTVSATVLSFVE